MKAVLFDLDGTLADTLADIAFAMNRTLKSFDQPTHPIDAYRYFVGDGVRTLIERALADDQQHLVQPVLDVYMPYLMEHGADRAALYPGIAQMLDTLVEREVPIAVLSNKPHASACEVVMALASQWNWAVVRGQLDSEPHKPDPTGALAVAKKLNIEPADCFFVGDTRVDMETAVNAGMFGVGCTWGFRDREELEEYGAKVIIDTPKQLIDVVCGI